MGFNQHSTVLESEMNLSTATFEADLTPIQEFYKESVIFLTGVTGFLGHVLLEKLLRSCPDISKFFVMVRNKKGKDIQSRLDEVLDNVTFDQLRKEYPDFKNKVVPIAGDCTLPGLGLGEEDIKKLIDEVNYCFFLIKTINKNKIH